MAGVVKGSTVELELSGGTVTIRLAPPEVSPLTPYDNGEFVSFARALGGPVGAWADALDGMAPAELDVATPAILRALKVSVYGEAATVPPGIRSAPVRDRRR